MRCCICASGCSGCTTNLRRNEDEHEKEMVDRAAGDYRNPAVYLRGRRSGDASVELAAASALRLADAWLLAGSGIAGAVPDSVRRAAPRRTGRAWRRPMARALPEYESGGAGEIPESDGRGLQLRFARYRILRPTSFRGNSPNQNPHLCRKE